MSRKENFNDVKVYNMNDVDYVASKWDKESTLKHYIKEFNLFEFEDEQDTRNFTKYHCIFERVSFIKSEVESLLKLYQEG